VAKLVAKLVAGFLNRQNCGTLNYFFIAHKTVKNLKLFQARIKIPGF
jgi:hypothetical protein